MCMNICMYTHTFVCLVFNDFTLTPITVLLSLSTKISSTALDRYTAPLPPGEPLVCSISNICICM